MPSELRLNLKTFLAEHPELQMLLNATYERGHSEGWNSCLRKVQEDGLPKVLEREGFLPPVTPPLPIEEPCPPLKTT